VEVEEDAMNQTNAYTHLGPRPESSYRQLFVKGTRTRAETIYRYTVGPEPRTPEEVARDCGLPVEVVMECIDYCRNNEDLLRQERDEEAADLQSRRTLKPVPMHGTSAV
jgi:hypothetical protein